jgi:transposase
MNYEVIIAQKSAEITSMAKSYESLKLSYDEYKISTQEQILNLQHQLSLLQKLIYGKRSERFIPDQSNQPNLFSILQQEEPIQEAESVPATKQVNYERKVTNQKGRQMLSNCGHLPVEETILDVQHDEELKRIGEQISERLAFKPGRLYRKQIIRPKYVNAQGEIVIADLPETAIPRCEADNTLLAQIVTSKFVDHTPEYRQQQIFKREGVTIAPSTMNNWTHQVAALMKLVALQIKKEILSSSYIQIDESTIKVLFEKQGTTHKGYMWVVVDPNTKNVYFEYQKGRGREGPKQLLQDYKGKVQSDGYGVYDHLDAVFDEIDFYCCWAHSRRKFIESEINDKKRSQQFLQFIQELYRIEAECREVSMSYTERSDVRHNKSISILQTMKDWLDKEAILVTPKSPIGQAISYTLARWDKLVKYASSGNVEIDNNLVENAIRPLAIGRKNYLFAGGHDAAVDIGYIYTVFNTCKALEVNQYNYLVWFLDNLPNMKITEINNYTPAAYKKIMNQATL